MATARRDVIESGDHRDSPAAGEKLDERFVSRVLPYSNDRPKRYATYYRSFSFTGWPVEKERRYRHRRYSGLRRSGKENTSSGRARRSKEADGAYLWADGIYAKARLGKEKAALLVVIGVQTDGSKRLLALEPGIVRAGSRCFGAAAIESARVKCARLFVGDGNLGLWARVGEVYPQAQEQLCWNHKLLNLMDAVSHKEQAQAKLHLAAMMLWRQPAGGVEGTKEIRASVSAQSQSGQDGGGELGEADDSRVSHQKTQRFTAESLN